MASSHGDASTSPLANFAGTATETQAQPNADLKTPTGLSQSEAHRRLRQEGPNELPAARAMACCAPQSTSCASQ